LKGQFANGLERAAGSTLARLGGTLQLTALDGGRRELGRDEQRAPCSSTPWSTPTGGV
jgi:hypothetical protein